VVSLRAAADVLPRADNSRINHNPLCGIKTALSLITRVIVQRNLRAISVANK
jgi:hypothetical protein